ncbi:hypothetical protein Pmani_001194 [Petrolisthes manimaculis]|uniref:Uncharacterized protein n=1 Tax=Petrolisthes manimaculis TaxID=1843537 RepID=A0AAE1UPM4_9EUCA|nr:hypothetical protein Pmani_001194 [Petrolisthes manimaculis]
MRMEGRRECEKRSVRVDEVDRRGGEKNIMMKDGMKDTEDEKVEMMKGKGEARVEKSDGIEINLGWGSCV